MAPFAGLVSAHTWPVAPTVEPVATHTAPVVTYAELVVTYAENRWPPKAIRCKATPIR